MQPDRTIVVTRQLPQAMVDRIQAGLGPAAQVEYLPIREPASFRDHTHPVIAYPSPEAVAQSLAGADGVVGRVPGDLAARAGRARWVQLATAAVGEKDLAWLRRFPLFEQGLLTVTSAAGVHAGPIAEWVIAALLHFRRDLDRTTAAQRDGRWDYFVTGELAGTTLGIIGAGHIGRAVATRASALGMRVIGLRRRDIRALPPGFDDMLPAGDLLPFLARCDAVVLAAPLTPETRDLVDATALRAMKPSAVLVNVARGELVDEAALLDALRSGTLRGAALDVFRTEPLPPESGFWSLPNVLIGAHMGGVTHRFNERFTDLVIQNALRFLAGEPLRNRYDPGSGY